MTDVRLKNNKLLHQVSLTDPLLAFHHAPHISTFHSEGLSTVTCVRIVVQGNQMRGISTKQNIDFRFQDVNIISDNRGVEGGGIYVDNSLISLQYLEARINFFNNTATLTGGAIHVVPMILFRSSPPACFFNIQRNQFTRLQRSILLRNNSAGLSGKSLYGGNIDTCELRNVIPFNQTGTSIFKLLFDIPWNASLTEVTSDIYRVCFCINNEPVCGLRVWHVTTYPGGHVLVPAVAVGQLGGTNPGIVQSRITDSDTARIADQEERQQVGVKCQEITYTIHSLENAQFKLD
ncbi:hypothetical protein SPONN_678 [uncultured Candidatus Thioglobus sp.]|nr:hypothetical protein SPONN_678 [uncultured Candidatus Thioglobus sp.]